MGARELNTVIDYLHTVVRDEHSVGTRDGELLHRFVRQHGPMVLGVCRRVLQHAHDAEDAFQATFLVLARKAATLRSPGTVANWLYGVAQRTALEMRKSTSK